MSKISLVYYSATGNTEKIIKNINPGINTLATKRLFFIYKFPHF